MAKVIEYYVPEKLQKIRTIHDPATKPKAFRAEKIHGNMVSPPLEWPGDDDKLVQQTCDCEGKSQ